MPDTIVFPSNAKLKEIEQELMPILTEDDELLKLFPVATEDADTIKWEQADNFFGLQEVRGIDGQPSRVARTGFKAYQMEPGYYGEFIEITEKEITERRQPGTLGDTIDLSDLVYKRQEHLLSRRIDRQRKMIADLIVAGKFTSTNALGQIIHTDEYKIKTFSAGTAWSTLATSTPLADIRAACIAAKLGQSAVFNQKARIFMNSTTLSYMLNNTNSADIGGKRQAGGATFNSVVDINRILADNDLPQIVEYHEGWSANGSSYSTFIPNGKAVIIGARKTGVPVGRLTMTRNANNSGAAPGPYTMVWDSASAGNNPVPRKIQVHDGFNGGIELWYGGAVVSMSV